MVLLEILFDCDHVGDVLYPCFFFLKKHVVGIHIVTLARFLKQSLVFSCPANMALRIG